jgi:hypothetical protein
MNYSFEDMSLDELEKMRFSLTQEIKDRTELNYKEEEVQDLASTKALHDFVKKHKKVKIEANIPVVIEYDLSPIQECMEYYYIEDLEQMFCNGEVYGYVKAGKGLKPGMKTFIDDHLEHMEICPEGIKLFNPDLWKQMTADFKNFLKLKG